jgi:hypothetical protein
MNPTEHDDDFELRLRRRERLVPQFDADLEGPDADVDRAVLARARTTLRQAPAAPPRHYRAPRWMLPFALAATVLLSFTLVLQMDSADVVPPHSADPAVGAAREADAAATVGNVTLQAPLSEAPSPALTREQAPTAGPVPELKTAPVSATVEVLADAAPAAAPAEPPPAAPPAPRALAAEPVAGSTVAAAQRRVERISDAAAAGESVDAVRAASPDSLEPAAWLERIERLRTAGELAAARRELAAFRGRHPDFELPPALRALLEP